MKGITYKYYNLNTHYNLNDYLVSLLNSVLFVCTDNVCGHYCSTLARSLSLPNLPGKVKKGIICLLRSEKEV